MRTPVFGPFLALVLGSVAGPASLQGQDLGTDPYDVVDNCRRTGRQPAGVSVGRLTRWLTQAESFYYKRILCLQRSAAWTHLLRRYGVPAQLVIGVRTFPFEAHAWVESKGRVLNDAADYTERFSVLDRIPAGQ